MNNRGNRYFRRLREKGWSALEAYRAAQTSELFEELERQDLVRLREEPDYDYDFSFLTDREYCSEKAEKEERARAARLGVWGIIVEARDSDEDPWEHIESCWGFIGDDWQDSGYDTEFKRAAIEWCKGRGERLLLKQIEPLVRDFSRALVSLVSKELESASREKENT